MFAARWANISSGGSCKEKTREEPGISHTFYVTCHTECSFSRLTFEEPQLQHFNLCTLFPKRRSLATAKSGPSRLSWDGLPLRPRKAANQRGPHADASPWGKPIDLCE